MSINSLVGGSAVFSSASGGKIYAFNTIGNAVVLEVAPANPSRRKITFHNPSDVDIFVAPLYKQNDGTSALLNPNSAALGGCFLVFANGATLEISGECQGAWQAFARTGTLKPFTVMDTNLI